MSGLEGGKSYVLAAVPSSYYTFSSWSKTNASSSIADTGAATTTYTVDGATDTITPSATSNAKGVTVNFSYAGGGTAGVSRDRKSTRLNSSHPTTSSMPSSS